MSCIYILLICVDGCVVYRSNLFPISDILLSRLLHVLNEVERSDQDTLSSLESEYVPFPENHEIEETLPDNDIWTTSFDVNHPFQKIYFRLVQHDNLASDTVDEVLSHYSFTPKDLQSMRNKKLTYKFNVPYSPLAFNDESCPRNLEYVFHINLNLKVSYNSLWGVFPAYACNYKKSEYRKKNCSLLLAHSTPLEVKKKAIGSVYPNLSLMTNDEIELVEPVAKTLMDFQCCLISLNECVEKAYSYLVALLKFRDWKWILLFYLCLFICTFTPYGVALICLLTHCYIEQHQGSNETAKIITEFLEKRDYKPSAVGAGNIFLLLTNFFEDPLMKGSLNLKKEGSQEKVNPNEIRVRKKLINTAKFRRTNSGTQIFVPFHGCKNLTDTMKKRQNFGSTLMKFNSKKKGRRLSIKNTNINKITVFRNLAKTKSSVPISEINLILPQESLEAELGPNEWVDESKTESAKTNVQGKIESILYSEFSNLSPMTKNQSSLKSSECIEQFESPFNKQTSIEREKSILIQQVSQDSLQQKLPSFREDHTENEHIKTLLEELETSNSLKNFIETFIYDYMPTEIHQLHTFIVSINSKLLPFTLLVYNVFFPSAHIQKHLRKDLVFFVNTMSVHVLFDYSYYLKLVVSKLYQ